MEEAALQELCSAFLSKTDLARLDAFLRRAYQIPVTSALDAEIVISTGSRVLKLPLGQTSEKAKNLLTYLPF
jgi:hypothetical protein